jgi:hypothetical protein
MKTKEQILSDKTSPRIKTISLDLGLEPIRKAKKPISGHAITISNYTGGSYRVANTWGDDWADKGTAYALFNDNMPTEAWLIHYNETTKGLEKQIKAKDGFWWKVKKFIQKNIL